ncbi:MAG: hypothetical protein M3O01_02505 [Pseudomonadota bacterium]|nr:hypothetical protein [Pseudomonadota bacterium]
MSVLRLELDVDSAAHPELYEALAAIENSAFWAERLRCLATAGLIVQRLRATLSSAEQESAAAADMLAPHLALVPPGKAAPPPRFDIPVLRDEVPAEFLPRSLEDTPDSAPLAPERSTAEAAAAETVDAVDVHAIDPPGAPESTGLIHMSGRRSRLLRMRSKGLFRNE